MIAGIRFAMIIGFLNATFEASFAFDSKLADSKLALLVSTPGKTISIGSPLDVTFKLINLGEQDRSVSHPNMNHPVLQMTLQHGLSARRMPRLRRFRMVSGKRVEVPIAKGAGPTVLRLTPRMAHVTSFEAAFSPADTPFPGVWYLEASDEKNRIESDSVPLKFILAPTSIEFVIMIVGDRKIPIHRRRLWARYLEVICPNIGPPRWPLSIDSPNTRNEKEIRIQSYLEAVSMTWGILDREEQSALLKDRQKSFAAITIGFYLR